MNYTLVRSKRKTVAIQIKGNKLTVRAPLKMPQSKIDEFVNSRRDWIEKHMLSSKPPRPFSKEELESLLKAAEEYFPERIEYYAHIIGVEYNKVSFKFQSTRWGSCSGKGNLNFNALLMLLPPEVIDSVIVHELCHLLEMNHSKKFYSHVLLAYPDYYTHHSRLKTLGRELIMRLEETKTSEKHLFDA